MHVAAFIGELQHYKNFKPSYLSTGKWAISPFLVRPGHISSWWVIMNQLVRYLQQSNSIRIKAARSGNFLLTNG